MIRLFDTISHDWLIRFIEHRIGDRRVIRLIRKWLAAGVLEEGRRIETVEGTPQGAVITPRTQKITFGLGWTWARRVRLWRVSSRGVSWKRNGVADHDLVVSDEDVFHQEPKYTLTLRDVEGSGR